MKELEKCNNYIIKVNRNGKKDYNNFSNVDNKIIIKTKIKNKDNIYLKVIIFMLFFFLSKQKRISQLNNYSEITIKIRGK